MDNILRYSEFRIVNFHIRPDKSVGMDIYGHNYDRIKKKCPVIYFSKDAYSNDSPKQVIGYRTYNPWLASLIKDTTLYFAEGCKVPRDLVRNSGYKITYSPDKADYIIIPKPKDEVCYEAKIIVKDLNSEIVYVCRVDNHCVNMIYDASFLVGKLASEIDVERFDLDFFAFPDLQSFKVWRIQDLPEYNSILLGDNSKSYIYEHELPLTPSNILSVETLDLWRRLAKSDDNMLEKCILNSDARKYPFTMYMFMNYDKDLRYISRTQKIRWMMETMDINNSWNTTTLVQPEDLNLIQDYIMYISGASENGGYITSEKYYELPTNYQKIIRSRYAVAPIKVKNPVLYSDIETIAKNS